ncbi:autophagy-related protein 11 [Punica granatum]|uniref:Autophagy-related protein 11 n=1 Tax=Punica granatum TaxID=22663 RepID=A0A6P8CX62_PUNGR|nr:autophagy-related protein 11 [Punica granatum]
MSSSVSDGSNHGGKLLVHISENGHSFEVECDETTPTDAIMRFVQSMSGIDFNDQLVLCSEMKLEPQRPLSAYKLPSDDREVFIFNKARLQSNSPPPPFERVETLEVADPPSPSSSHKPHPLDDALDPALKALPSYERQFRHHYHCGNSIYSRSQLRYETCQRLYREQKVQERALEVARANLEQYYRIINQNFTEFMKRYLQQHRVHFDLLSNFRRDMDRLQSVKLHPALQMPTCKCLLDLVKEENLQKAAENCENSHRQFENKVSQFKQMFVEVKRRVEDVLASKTCLPINLELSIRQHHQYINEQRSIMQSLSKDVDTVKKLVDDCLSGHLSSSLRPHDAVSALGPMYDVHDKNHLPTMKACDRALYKLLNFCKDKKNEMNIFVHNYVQRITYVSSLIKDARLQFPVFREAMVRQDDLFMELKLVRGIGPAYRACLAEIVRRKASMKLYMGLAGQLAERLAIKREAEVSRREEFLKEQSSFIPADILASMGLFDTPNQCDVNIAPFDTNLLDIDIQDLDLYAPDYFTGIPSKLEKQGSLKGSLIVSSDSPRSAESAELAGGSLDLQNFDELLEGSELVEVAGTCKMEVENAKLKAEYASAVALICSISPLVDYESLDDSKVESALKNAAEKTSEALHLKDEYAKHLNNMLKMKQMQCLSYEKRIHELEQKLSQVYLQDPKPSSSEDAAEPPVTAIDCNRSGGSEIHMPCIYTSESMDEVSCVSDSVDRKSCNYNRQLDEPEGGLGNMMDSPTLDFPLNSLLLERPHNELCADDDGEKDNKIMGQSGLSRISSAHSMNERIAVPCGPVAVTIMDSEINDARVLELQNSLAGKSSQLSETESRFKAAMEEIALLRKELEVNQKLLGESQMNCAHLENCLHEAREEAQTHLCAANRRASEYSALRASAVKMCTLFERLRTCLYNSGGIVDFADSLQALAQSLHHSMSEKEDDGSAELQKCIQILADRVGFLSMHRDEQPDKFPKLEAANEQLRKELEDKKEMIKALYTKHQLEKQAKKEKISFGHLEVHEIAAFVLNSWGQYVAINRNSSNYYLSAESVALFTDHLQSRPSYIVGLIVHIERRVVKPSSAPRSNKKDRTASDAEIEKLALSLGFAPSLSDLPIDSEYFVVTVAMLPGTSTPVSPAQAS